MLFFFLFFYHKLDTISYWKKNISLKVLFCLVSVCYSVLRFINTSEAGNYWLPNSNNFIFIFFLNTFIRSHVLFLFLFLFFFVFALWNLHLHIYVETSVLLWDLAIVYYIRTLLLLCSFSSRSKYISNSHSQSLCQCVYSFCCPVLLLYIFFRNGAL